MSSGAGKGSGGERACSASMSTQVWIPSTHVSWAWQQVPITITDCRCTQVRHPPGSQGTQGHLRIAARPGTMGTESECSRGSCSRGHTVEYLKLVTEEAET